MRVRSMPCRATRRSTASRWTSSLSEDDPRFDRGREEEAGEQRDVREAQEAILLAIEVRADAVQSAQRRFVDRVVGAQDRLDLAEILLFAEHAEVAEEE